MFEKHRLSKAEQAVQAKLKSGRSLNSDDREIVQTRLRALQRRGDLDGQSGGVPSGATHAVPMPSVGPVWQAMNAAGQDLASSGSPEDPPDFSGLASDIEAPIRSINSGNQTATFNGSVGTHWRGAPRLWKARGSFALGTIHWNQGGGGTGTAGGGQTTGGGNAGGQTQASGAGGSAGASGTYSGANLSGQGSASVGGANSNAASTAGNASQGGSMSTQFDSYTAPIVCTWHISVEMDTTWNPLSWLSSGGRGSRDGTTEAGRFNFQMPA
jgi:hypothetical protein